MNNPRERRDFEPTKTLLHHCEGGQWFYDTRDFVKSGVFAYQNESDTTTIALNSPEGQECRVCHTNRGQMEEEYKQSHPDYLTDKDPLNPYRH